MKFTANGEDYPAFISVIPLILDLDEAQDLDRKKTLQRLCKILIQKMPLDKNGELIFDVDEAQQLHNNAVQMLTRAIGVDVLTTFADVSVEDLLDNQATAQSDDLVRVERQLYNEAGISQMQFNTDGNIALEKSILNDEATLYNMLLQFENFLNELIEKYNSSKKMNYRVQLLTTTIYNYKELSKLYKEQMQIGFSKMLPQIALGQSQSSILANAYLSSLERTINGMMHIEDATTIESIEKDITSGFVSLKAFGQTLKTLDFSEQLRKKIDNGVKLETDAEDGLCSVYIGGAFYAIGQVKSGTLEIVAREK